MKRFFLLWIAVLWTVITTAQVSITNGSFTYLQDFDGLVNTGTGTWTNNSTLSGWYASLTSYTANNGSSNAGSLYSYGTTSATDRALGGINTNALGTIYYGIRLKNDTGSDINSISISFDGEEWRDQNANDQSVTFSYQIGATVTSLTAGTWTNVTALDFTSPQSISAGQLDGNAAANRVAGISNTISLTIPAGQEIMLRWLDDNATANDHGLSIDNFSITAVTLPIVLSEFRAKVVGHSTLLTFTTATELNNSHFVIERSSNNQTWAEIGQVRGAGTSTEEQSYTFTDEKPLVGANYYRLKQVDFDGKYEYSPIRVVQFGKTASVLLSPSPVADRLTVKVAAAYEEDAQVDIIAVTGQIVRSTILAAESTNLEVDVTGLPKGIYTLRIIAAGQEQVTKQFQVDGL
jgi:hypothetical protein